MEDMTIEQLSELNDAICTIEYIREQLVATERKVDWLRGLTDRALDQLDKAGMREMVRNWAKINTDVS